MSQPPLSITSRRAPRRIAVFRALQLGDMLCAVPALRALRAAEPDAHITLVGLPWAADFAARFAAYLDDFIPFPGAQGLIEQPIDTRAVDGFYAACHAREFDLAIQLHGSGPQSNQVVARLGARRTAGFVPRTGQRSPLDHAFAWPTDRPEPLRYLALMASLGYPARGEHLEFPLDAADHALARKSSEAHGLRAGRYLVVHPGARLASRRWPVARFAAAARALADEGLQVVLTGTPGEAALAREFAAAFAGPHVDLVGRTSLGGLAALIAGARLLVCNDTGVSHVAAALGTPSVVVACGSEVARWAPTDTARHRVLADHPACRPCMFEVCPYGHECAMAIEPDAVVEAARALAMPEPRHVR
ncbi:ADP-heptose--LPS heptosyltransferase [Burkholderia gladioli]|uniref:glycosyltransferase family 9 protein n=1 Tax=Burkholderia gladioli TaxID=28095 RepID=UPI000756F8A2|nr:glycosyltransferase family 9 protein [Burkholderia gladioli]KVM58908.1 ADP-heptose--LPS heptosyltransferase [Burkholderia gladioli]